MWVWIWDHNRYKEHQRAYYDLYNTLCLHASFLADHPALDRVDGGILRTEKGEAFGICFRMYERENIYAS